MSDTRNYQLVYPDSRKGEDEPTGGYVEVHITHHSHESRQNQETGIYLAKLGYKVRLLGIVDTPGIKNPDAFLVDEQLIVEFKHNQTATPSAIENEVRDAKKQADYILLHILSSLTKDDLIKGLRRCIHRAENVLQVWIIFQDELYQFTPAEIRDKTIERKIK